MEQNRFFKVMSNSSSYSNINGIEDVKGKKMSFEKLNNNPGIGHIKLRDNDIMKKYTFSDHPIVNEIRRRKRKKETLKKRLQHFLTQRKKKKRKNKTNKKKKAQSKKKKAQSKKKKANSKKK
jgi:hypothetical protein